MTRPNFTADETYLISYVKSSHGRPANSYMWGYLISSSFVFGFGVYQASIPVMVIAFIVLVGFRLYEEWYGSKWTPIWRCIVEKFESALDGDTAGRTSPNDNGG